MQTIDTPVPKNIKPDLGPLTPDNLAKVEQLVTEDDEPAESFYIEKQRCFLTQTLYDACQQVNQGCTFLACANVGLFYHIDYLPLVPDVMVSLNVQLPDDLWEKNHRAYMTWHYHKLPDVVIELVANEIGGEADVKKLLYAQLGVPFYVIYDPEKYLSDQVLYVYRLALDRYIQQPNAWMEEIQLGLMVWQGQFERCNAPWLRWCDQHGTLLLTGEERADMYYQRTEQLHQHAEYKASAYEQIRAKSERLAAQLRALGIDPDQIQ